MPYRVMTTIPAYGLLATLLTIALFAATAFAASTDGSASPTTAPRSTPSPSKGDPPAAVPPNAVVMRDITYCTVDGTPLKLDIYMPEHRSGTRAPLVVHVHGGAWKTGDKANGIWLEAVMAEMINRGYVVASINYRMMPKYVWPAFIEDAKCSIRFLRANAAKYGIDPKRVGIWGGSAGGQLVALMGTADENAHLEGTGGYLDQSSRVQAVAEMFGVADMIRQAEYGDRAVRAGFGQSTETLRLSSPVTYVSRDDPPFLILEGEKDKVTPPFQAQLMRGALIDAGASATLVMVKNAGHGLTDTGGPISPTREELTQTIANFFDSVLKATQ